MSRGSDPAFPEQGLSGLPNGDFIYGRPGITMREHYALTFAAAIVAHYGFGGGEQDRIADSANKLADALLAKAQP